jgi:hypothetical protein
MQMRTFQGKGQRRQQVDSSSVISEKSTCPELADQFSQKRSKQFQISVSSFIHSYPFLLYVTPHSIIFHHPASPKRETMFSNMPTRSTAAGLFPGSKLTAAGNRNTYEADFQAVVFCGYGES